MPLGLSSAYVFSRASDIAMNTIHKQIKKANTSWVATADKLLRSLRSMSPAPPCHHI